MPPDVPVQRYSDFSTGNAFRGLLRDCAVFGLSLGRSIARSTGWIRFPYYHHVFDDEQAGFARQLKYLAGFGDFISLDDALQLVGSDKPIEGRYFCITFDDGFKNCATHATPLLVEHKAPASFYLTTDFIGTDLEQDREKLLGFFDHGQTLMQFLDWQDCRDMAAAGMTIGSHTVHHSRLATLDAEQALTALTQSKAVIEENMAIPCPHFCAPFGIPGRDFKVERDPDLARQAGYQSMATTERGVMRSGDDPLRIRRDHVLANWGNHQLRYFLSL